jgi:hypothetical protein
MKTIEFYSILLLLSIIVLPATGQQKPNIIFIMADDLGYGEIGPFGQKLIHTPHLDQMANEGMKLTDFYANSICAPSMLKNKRISQNSA